MLGTIGVQETSEGVQIEQVDVNGDLRPDIWRHYRLGEPPAEGQGAAADPVPQGRRPQLRWSRPTLASTSTPQAPCRRGVRPRLRRPRGHALRVPPGRPRSPGARRRLRWCRGRVALLRRRPPRSQGARHGRATPASISGSTTRTASSFASAATSTATAGPSCSKTQSSPPRARSDLDPQPLSGSIVSSQKHPNLTDRSGPCVLPSCVPRCPRLRRCLLSACGGGAANAPVICPRADFVIPPAKPGLHLRVAFDDDPSDMIGRFLPNGLQLGEIDESQGMQTRCSRYITYKELKAGGTYVEYIQRLARPEGLARRRGPGRPRCGGASAAGTSDSAALRVRLHPREEDARRRQGSRRARPLLRGSPRTSARTSTSASS